MRICILQSNPEMGNLKKNFNWISNKVIATDADLFVAPEMALIGYPPDDLIDQRKFIKDQIDLLNKLQKYIGNKIIIIGGVSFNNNSLRNSAFIISRDRILVQDKISLPSYGVFDEKRFFESGESTQTFKIMNKKFCILICEDFWDQSLEAHYSKKEFDYLVIINASPFELNKDESRINRAQEINKFLKTNIIYVNMVGGQDDLVFDGGSFLIDKNNYLIGQLPFFKAVSKTFIFNKHLEYERKLTKNPEEIILKALVAGTQDYLKKNKIKRVFIGLSGGIDSALVTYIASKAINKTSITCVMMSSVFTSKISKIDAKKLSDNLGITYKNRNLSTLIKQINNALKIDFKGKPADVTEENIQARARGIFLMALANKGKGVVLSTSNKSESAVGYSTLYGDMVGAYAPIKDIPKTMVYQLAKYINKNQEIIPERIITRAPSAELRDNQKDQDSLPDYETLDKVIDLYIEKNKSINEIIKAGFQPIIVKKIVKLILSSEFKRRQSPPGPKVTTKAFGRDRRYPITNNYLG